MDGHRIPNLFVFASVSAHLPQSRTSTTDNREKHAGADKRLKLLVETLNNIFPQVRYFWGWNESIAGAVTIWCYKTCFFLWLNYWFSHLSWGIGAESFYRKCKKGLVCALFLYVRLTGLLACQVEVSLVYTKLLGNQNDS